MMRALSWADTRVRPGAGVPFHLPQHARFALDQSGEIDARGGGAFGSSW